MPAAPASFDLAVPVRSLQGSGVRVLRDDIDSTLTMNPSSQFRDPATLQARLRDPHGKTGACCRRKGAVTAEQMRQCKQRMNLC